MSEHLIDNCFIDLNQCLNPADMIYKLGNKLENGEYNNKTIIINLGNLDLNESQLMSLKSLIESVDSDVAAIYTDSYQTQMAALKLGIIITDADAESEQDAENKTETDREFESEIEETIEICKTPEQKEEQLPTLHLKQTLRSGQTVSFDGNVVIIGDCNPGSEIIAAGDITVWGVFSGIAHAGAKGKEDSCIRALRINAIQLRIGSHFARRPDNIDVEKVEKATAFVPEEAKIIDGEIVIYTLNE